MSADTTEEKTVAGLLERQDELQREGCEVLERLNLIRTLSKIGSVTPVGSYATGLMAWRDIDVNVRCNVELWNPEAVMKAMVPFASVPGVKKLHYANEVTEIHKGDPLMDGYYWGIHYYPHPDAMWKLDVWFWPSDAPTIDIQYAEDLKARLMPETRGAILRLKGVYCIQPFYRHEVFSVDIYDAVLEHGVRTPGEFAAYLVRRGKPSVT